MQLKSKHLTFILLIKTIKQILIYLSIELVHWVFLDILCTDVT